MRAALCIMEHRKRKSYDLSFKLKAIESAEKTTNESTVREFKVDPKQIHEWCYQKNKIVAMKKPKKIWFFSIVHTGINIQKV